MKDQYILELKREGLTFRDHVQGILRVKKVWDTGKDCREDNLGSFLTMERGTKYVNLKVGTYQMKHSIKISGRKVKCLRPTNWRIGTLLIHDALNDDARNVTGCIAPFPFGGQAYGQSSAEAMEQLWMMLGGWQKDKKVTLKVITNVPGDARTKEDWKRLKPPRRRRGR